MGGYVTNFTVYTMAMIGLICFAVFVYKKFMDGGISSRSSKFLSVEESMSLSPRKTLHVVRAGNERFLVASDVDRTTLISKLEQKSQSFNDILPENIVTQSQEDLPQVDSIFQQKSIPEAQIGPQNVSQNQDVEEFVVPNYSINRPQKRRNRAVVAMDFSKKSKGKKVSPMQEMAKRINEL